MATPAVSPAIPHTTPKMGVVAAMYTTPETVIEDYGKLLKLANYQDALAPGTQTLLKINLSWTAKPRRGLGLSASSITNQYLKLSGTLSKPRVTVKPLKATATTTAAVGTAGLSLLAKGFWDRFTSTKRVCKNAEKKYGID